MALDTIPFEEWIWMIYGFFSCSVHCLVLVTIFRARFCCNASFFRGPFFTIVLIQGVHEVLEFLTVNFMNRFRKYRLIAYDIAEDNNIVEWEWYWYQFVKIILYFGHMEIALNRLSAFLFTGLKSYDKVWNTGTIVIYTGLIYLTAVILRAAVYSPDLKCTTSLYNGTDIMSVRISGNLTIYDSQVDMAVSSVSAIVCILCYTSTAFLARRWKMDTQRTMKREMLLLKCGAATFLILLPTPIRSAVELWATNTGHLDIQNAASQLNLIPAEAMAVFQPWLLILSCSALRERMLNLCYKEKTTRKSTKTENHSISVTHM